MRELTPFENILCEMDNALRTLLPPSKRLSNRPSPALAIVETHLSHQEKCEIAGLMRVNLAGEVCAQALYRGQALTAKLPKVKKQMAEAAEEETDHLAWCEQRLCDLSSHPSVLNPFWYVGSFLLGALAGKVGDRWSLGFVAETERQVSEHLQNHLKQLPPQDKKTQVILEQMYKDELQHAEGAIKAGAAVLPSFIKKLMRHISRLMTRSSYYI